MSAFESPQFGRSVLRSGDEELAAGRDVCGPNRIRVTVVDDIGLERFRIPSATATATAGQMLMERAIQTKQNKGFTHKRSVVSSLAVSK